MFIDNHKIYTHDCSTKAVLFRGHRINRPHLQAAIAIVLMIQYHTNVYIDLFAQKQSQSDAWSEQ